jgi:hypothetical protein
MKYLFSYLIVIFVSCQAFSQVPISEFIGSAGDDPEVKSADAQINYLQSKPYRLSPLQKLEFRTRNRELMSTQQEYALRFNPANPWEMRSNNKYFQEFSSSLSFEKELALKSALVDRYNLVILYLYYYELKSLAVLNDNLVEKQLSILERQSASSFFDADEYVKLKIEQLDKSVEKEEADFEWQSQKSAVSQLYPAADGKSILWEAQALITVDRMEQVADSLVKQMISPLEVAYRKQQVNVARSQYNLEKSNINPGFLQTSYDQRRVNQDRNPIIISLGVTIPIVNPNKGDMARRKLEEIESEYELKSAQIEDQTSQDIAYLKLKESIGRYRDLQRKIEELKNSSLQKDLTLLKSGDPLIALQFDAGLNKLRVLQSKLKRKALTYYVEFLTESDHLQHIPLVNYLSGNLTPVD